MSASIGELVDSAHAWFINPADLPARVIEESAEAFSADERARFERFKSDESRRDFAAGRALCRAALSRYASIDPARWKFSAGAGGKPAISAPARFRALRFNLTHTRELVACVLTRAGPVGIDAEHSERKVDVSSIARNFFSEAEQAWLGGASAPSRRARFFQLWVLKEAYIKGRGLGIPSMLRRAAIRFDERGEPLPIGKWHLSLHAPSPCHVAAVAIRAPRPVPVTWHHAEALFKA